MRGVINPKRGEMKELAMSSLLRNLSRSYTASNMAQLEQLYRCPAELFRTNNPSLDPRRVRRHFRKIKGRVVTVNYD